LIDLELENKVVIITGGSGGIGSACAREFLRQGAFVSIVDIDKKSGMLLEEELLVEYPGRARFFECDLTNIDSTCSVVDSTYGRLMTGTEILVDAGIAAGGFNGTYVIPNTELS